MIIRKLKKMARCAWRVCEISLVTDKSTRNYSFLNKFSKTPWSGGYKKEPFIDNVEIANSFKELRGHTEQKKQLSLVEFQSFTSVNCVSSKLLCVTLTFSILMQTLTSLPGIDDLKMLCSS